MQSSIIIIDDNKRLCNLHFSGHMLRITKLTASAISSSCFSSSSLSYPCSCFYLLFCTCSYSASFLLPQSCCLSFPPFSFFQTWRKFQWLSFMFKKSNKPVPTSASIFIAWDDNWICPLLKKHQNINTISFLALFIIQIIWTLPCLLQWRTRQHLFCFYSFPHETWKQGVNGKIAELYFDHNQYLAKLTFSSLIDHWPSFNSLNTLQFLRKGAFLFI